MSTHKNQVGQAGAGVNGGEFAKKTQTEDTIALPVTPAAAEQVFADVFREYAAIEDRMYRARLAAIDAHARTAFPDGVRVVIATDGYEHFSSFEGFFDADGKKVWRHPGDPDYYAYYQAQVAISEHATHMYDNVEYYLDLTKTQPHYSSSLYELRVTSTPRTIDDFAPVDVYEITTAEAAA